ncbi:MAG TPA: hypothetical protein VGD42_02895 [Lysobacter sp.]
MNLFKGLLFLHGHFTTSEFAEDSKPEYGAATADREFAPKLGNRAASARWFDRFGVTPITECVPSPDGCG